MQNLQQLQKLAQIFNSDKIITPEDIDAILKGILTILSSYKQGTESLNQETKDVVNSLLSKTLEQANKLENDFSSTKKELISSFQDKVNEMMGAIQEMQKKVDGVKDGKDADEEAIIEEVINRIKIPAPENPIVETPETIKSKLESLPEDQRLDVNYIKGLNIGKLATREELTDSVLRLQNQARFLMSGNRVKSIVAGTNVTVDNTDPSNPVVSSTGGGTPGGSTTQIQYNSSGSFAGSSSLVWDNSNTRLVLGGSALGYSDTNLFESITSTVNSYNQLIIRNLSNGTTASSNLIVNNDSSTATTYYGEFGMNSSGFTGSGSLNLANSVYLSATSGDLVLGTTTSNKIRFLTNSATTDALVVDTAGLIGIGTAVPTHSLTLASTSTGISLYNTADQTTNYERSIFQWTGNVFIIRSQSGGTGTVRDLQLGNSSTTFTIGNFDNPFTAVRNSSSATYLGFTISGTQTQSSGTPRMFAITPTITQTSTAGYTALLVNPTESSTGSGTKLLIDAQVGGTSKFKVDNTGQITSISNTINLSSASIVRSGAHTLTLTTTNTTNVTFPTTGTLAISSAAQTFTGTQTFSQIVTTNNAITAAANAATVPVTSRLNTVTNNSAAGLTITMTTASAVDGQLSLVRVLDFSAVAQSITWVNTENSTVSVPGTTNGSTTLPITVAFQYNAGTSKWRCIASV